MPRVPATCPTNFVGHYTVNPGDTMFIISSIFRINLSEVIGANPHITNPNVVFPGDVLCVPGQISSPCCVTLDVVQPSSLGEVGVALVYTSFAGTQAISVMADALPAGYDVLIAEVDVPNQITSRQQLYPSPQTPPTFSGTISFPTAVSLTPDTTIRIYPAKSGTGEQGPVELQGSLNCCHR